MWEGHCRDKGPYYVGLRLHKTILERDLMAQHSISFRSGEDIQHLLLIIVGSGTPKKIDNSMACGMGNGCMGTIEREMDACLQTSGEQYCI